MIKLVTEITTSNWQMSPSGFGEILEDQDDISQCVNNIIFTRKGDVPFNPDFGTGVLDYIDQPQLKIAPRVVAEITNGINLFEKRVNIKSITTSYSEEGAIIFTISMIVVANASELKFSFNLSQFLN